MTQTGHSTRARRRRPRRPLPLALVSHLLHNETSGSVPAVRAILAALTFLIAVPSRSPAQKPTADAWSSVRDTIRAVMARSNVPSVSVAVARGGKIVWEEAFGWADRERMIAATPNTMYSLASISKPITATALMTLVERGTIDLDKPTNEYLGTGKLTGLSGDVNGATVRRVMSHTAGLPLHYQFYYANQPYPVLSNDETIARYGILVYPPGTVYQYSNLGYGIIDHIIARTARTDYADYLRTNVFVPLGLTRTSVGIATGLEPYVAQRYDAKQRPIPFYDFDHRGGSAVYSSAHDLLRFGMFHLKDHLPDQRPVLKDATIDAMQKPVAPAPYGLGWIVFERDGLRVISHTGGMPGVQTVLSLYPAEDVAYVVLLNMVADPTRIAREIERVVLPRFAEARQRWAIADSARRTGARGRTPFAPPVELVGEWTGNLRTWERSIPMTLVVKPDGDVHVRLEGQLETALNQPAWADSLFTGRFAGSIPTPDAARWPHYMELSVRLHGSALEGMASALTTTDPVYFALSSYVSLTKKVVAK